MIRLPSQRSTLDGRWLNTFGLGSSGRPRSGSANGEVSQFDMLPGDSNVLGEFFAGAKPELRASPANSDGVIV
jgi:hypothetical protein